LTSEVKTSAPTSKGDYPSITIAIPTYNRSATILRCLSTLSEKELPDNIQILVIDNNSEDDTFAVLQEFDNRNIRVLKNSQNIGFAGNTVELIQQCDTEYMIWNSDEDDILVENLMLLTQFLRENNPTFVAPQYYQLENGSQYLYRGKDLSTIIKHKDIWSFTHLPGLIFKISEAKIAVHNYRYWQDNFKVSFNLYPQIMIIAHLLIQGNGYWWNRPINQEVESLEETHDTINGAMYHNLSARWEQYKGFSNFFECLRSSTQGSHGKDIVKTYIESHNMWLISIMRSSIEVEVPDQLDNFDAALKLNFFTGMSKVKKVLCSVCLGYRFIVNRIQSK